ncbi:MAG: prepilin-type N-terminal cleavage/methylation domain-containing protein, partial [Verrucomicrobiota bacterium]|nr:prepilin-type N-terminal cleavage/methylation domain-containing protein [Verrucomicrobiota bacterium]
MFIATAKRGARSAFTLLEIMLSVMILALMALSIYRFVQTNITALRVSSDQGRIAAQYSGFENLISDQWSILPPG